jgi:hypothetical protein
MRRATRAPLSLYHGASGMAEEHSKAAIQLLYAVIPT